MAKYGYVRVSTLDQEYGVDAQIHQLIEQGISKDHIFAEKISGAVSAWDRPVLAKLLKKLAPDDTLIVSKVDRLGRNALDMLNLIHALQEKGVTVLFLDLGCATNTWMGRMVLMVLASLAEGERERGRERTIEGMAAAKRRGKLLGRRRALSSEQRDEVAKKLSLDIPIAQIARLFKVGKSTIYRTRDEIEANKKNAKDLPIDKYIKGLDFKEHG